jgi:predicted Zn-dependent peptidase
VQDDLTAYRAITTDDVKEVLKKYPLGQLSTATVGPLKAL